MADYIIRKSVDSYKVGGLAEKKVDKLLRGIKKIEISGGRGWVTISYSKNTSKLALALTTRIVNLILGSK